MFDRNFFFCHFLCDYDGMSIISLSRNVPSLLLLQPCYFMFIMCMSCFVRCLEDMRLGYNIVFTLSSLLPIFLSCIMGSLFLLRIFIAPSVYCLNICCIGKYSRFKLLIMIILLLLFIFIISSFFINK